MDRYAVFLIALMLAPAFSSADEIASQETNDTGPVANSTVLFDNTGTTPLVGARIPSWLYVLGAAILIAVSASVGMRQYRERKEREEREDARLQQMAQQEQVSVPVRSPEHNSTLLVRQYILAQRAKGVSETEIREMLLAVGWDELVVDMEMMQR